MTIFTIELNLSQHVHQPVAILINRLREYLEVGFAYESAWHPLHIYDLPTGLFEKNCFDCKFRRLQRCPGGEPYLRNNYQTSKSYTTPDGRYLKKLSRYLPCLKEKHGVPLIDVSTEFERIVKNVKIPNYILTSRADYCSRDTRPSDKAIYWYLAKPDAQTARDAWNVIPFSFANVYGTGNICLGDAINVYNPLDSSTISHTALNMTFNTDLAVYRTKNEFNSLGQYADALNQSQFDLIKRYSSVYNSSNDALNWINAARGSDQKIILPPEYKQVQFDNGSREIIIVHNNDQRFKLTTQGDLINVD